MKELDDKHQTQPEPDGSDDGMPDHLREQLPQLHPEALEAFFDAYFDRIYGFVRRLVHDEHLAEDLTQDIFVQLQRGMEKYDPSRALRPWVFTIATNKLRDFWRSRGHRDAKTTESVEQDSSAGKESDHKPRAEDILSEREMEASLRGAVEELSEGMRVTVQLRVFEGMSFEAIGEVVGRSEVAVRKRYSRALEVLRESLGPAWKSHTEAN